MFDLRLKHLTLLVSLSFGLMACANLAPTQSGFLTDYQLMQNDTALLRSFSAADLNLDLYTQLTIEPVRVLVTAKSGNHKQLQALAQDFHRNLQNDLQPVFYKRSASKQKGLRLTTAITAVDSSSYNLNLLSTVFLLAPLDTGGISVELEIQDITSGETLYTQTRSINGSVTQFRASFDPFGHADIGLRTISKDLSKMITAKQATYRLSSSKHQYK